MNKILEYDPKFMRCNLLGLVMIAVTHKFVILVLFRMNELQI